MRFLLALALLYLLPLYTFAAKKGSTGRFVTFLSRSQAQSPLKLDDASYDDLTSTPRDFTVIVLLTALEARFGCQLCREFQPEWDLLGKSWIKGDRQGDSRVIYGTLDFLDGKGTFQKVSSLGLRSYPVLRRGLIYGTAYAPNGSAYATLSTN